MAATYEQIESEYIDISNRDAWIKTFQVIIIYIIIFIHSKILFILHRVK